MKKIFLLSFLLFAGCYSAAQQKAEDDKWAKEHGYIVAEDEASPCDDPRFKALKQKPIDSLSMREYDFLRTTEDRCAKYNAQKAEEEKEKNTTSPFGVAVLVTLGVVVTFLVLHLVAGVL